jgi:restriction system protein
MHPIFFAAASCKNATWRTLQETENVTPREYEELVANHFRDAGYTVELTPISNDYGVDVFACKGTEKLAVQAKMYGDTTRRVNREMVMQLHGAKDFFGCTEAVVVTNGDLMQDAHEVAAKLRIRIVFLQAERSALQAHLVASDIAPKDNAISARNVFDQVWTKYVMPLAGKTLIGPSGKSNKVLSVDWSGVKRLTSGDEQQFIPIEVFRQAVGRIVSYGSVTRDEINQEYSKRASSGVVLILAQVPLFSYFGNPSRLKLRQLTDTQNECCRTGAI